MIKIIFSCNDKFFDGLYLSILSIIRRTKQPIEFYLLTADCTDIDPKYTALSVQHSDILKKLVKSYNDEHSFTLIDCRDAYDKYLKNNKNAKNHYSPYATFRLLLGKYDYFSSGKVIYLDVDTMACGDIVELFNIELNDNEFAVCHDALGKYWIRRDYFNSGVILFNMDLIKQTHLFDKAIEKLFLYKMPFPDQSALYKSVTKYMFFPNEFRFNRQQVKILPDTVIKHFCARVRWWPFLNNIKQWDIKHVHSILKIHTFDEDFAIYLKMKKENM